MKSSDLPETEFREILTNHLLPFFPKAELGARIAPTTNKSYKLVVQEGNNSASTLILKASVESKYRIKLWRSQPFSPEEKKLIECFLTALAGRDLPTTGAHRRDTLTSVVNETVARFACPDAKNFVLDLLHTLTDWAQQTYEGERIAFSAGVLHERGKDYSCVEFLAIAGEDFVKVLSNAQDSLLVFDKCGRLQRHENCANFQFPSNFPSTEQRRFAPMRFDDFARWTVQHIFSIIVTLNRHGEILIFRGGDLLLARRRGSWQYFTHEICLKQLTSNALVNVSERDFREELYLTALDVAFARTGGCIGVFRKEDEILGIDLVDPKDRLRVFNRDDEKLGIDLVDPVQRLRLLKVNKKKVTANALRAVINKRTFQEVDRLLRVELAGIDGSLVLDYRGNILAAGAILSIKSRSEDGGGRQAAAENLSEFGLGLKISNDGYIRAFGAREEIFTIG